LNRLHNRARRSRNRPARHEFFSPGINAQVQAFKRAGVGQFQIARLGKHHFINRDSIADILPQRPHRAQRQGPKNEFFYVILVIFVVIKFLKSFAFRQLRYPG